MLSKKVKSLKSFALPSNSHIIVTAIQTGDHHETILAPVQEHPCTQQAPRDPNQENPPNFSESSLNIVNCSRRVSQLSCISPGSSRWLFAFVMRDTTFHRQIKPNLGPQPSGINFYLFTHLREIQICICFLQDKQHKNILAGAAAQAASKIVTHSR